MGCQMNVYDSSKMAAMLTDMGYRPSVSFNNAAVVIINTCTIREKARQKAASFLGRLAVRKKKHPEMIVAVGGCVAQHEGKSLLAQFPFVDIVFGTGAIARLPELIRTVQQEEIRLVDIELTGKVSAGNIEILPQLAGVSEFVSIIRGCDNFCTYCVVPYVRGREASRSPDNVIREVRGLVAAGAREVTLLGQNVNSYGKKEGFCTFADLLARVNDIDGLERIRFATSHPKDLSPELARSFGVLDKLCNHFHLPVQSGSSPVLKRMNRKYTREDYIEKIDWLRKARGDIAVSTDIIVGFPGESPDDFEQTVSLLRLIEFDSIFAFMYSDREVAPASTFPGKISEDEKKQRLKTVLEIQTAISEKKNKAYAGTTVPVLVEGLSKSSETANKSAVQPATSSKNQWSGRTTSNKVVNFTIDQALSDVEAVSSGSVVQVRIENGFAHSLNGTAVFIDKQSTRAGGIYAA